MKHRRFYLLLGLAMILAAAVGMTRLRAQEEELDPVKMAPDTQKLVLENAFVRVTQERMKPGEGLRKHRHMRGLTIALADYQMEQKLYPSGEIVHSNRHFGDVNWTETFIHEAKNVGTTNQYVVRIELK